MATNPVSLKPPTVIDISADDSDLPNKTLDLHGSDSMDDSDDSGFVMNPGILTKSDGSESLNIDADGFAMRSDQFSFYAPISGISQASFPNGGFSFSDPSHLLHSTNSISSGSNASSNSSNNSSNNSNSGNPLNSSNSSSSIPPASTSASNASQYRSAFFDKNGKYVADGGRILMQYAQRSRWEDYIQETILPAVELQNPEALYDYATCLLAQLVHVKLSKEELDSLGPHPSEEQIKVKQQRKQYDTIFDLVTQAANMGLAIAKKTLGDYHLLVDGPFWYKFKDLTYIARKLSAFKLYSEAANLNFAPAHFIVCLMLMKNHFTKESEPHKNLSDVERFKIAYDHCFKAVAQDYVIEKEWLIKLGLWARGDGEAESSKALLVKLGVWSKQAADSVAADLISKPRKTRKPMLQSNASPLLNGDAERKEAQEPMGAGSEPFIPSGGMGLSGKSLRKRSQKNSSTQEDGQPGEDPSDKEWTAKQDKKPKKAPKKPRPKRIPKRKHAAKSRATQQAFPGLDAAGGTQTSLVQPQVGITATSAQNPDQDQRQPALAMDSKNDKEKDAVALLMSISHNGANTNSLPQRLPVQGVQASQSMSSSFVQGSARPVNPEQAPMQAEAAPRQASAPAAVRGAPANLALGLGVEPMQVSQQQDANVQRQKELQLAQLVKQQETQQQINQSLLGKVTERSSVLLSQKTIFERIGKLWEHTDKFKKTINECNTLIDQSFKLTTHIMTRGQPLSFNFSSVSNATFNLESKIAHLIKILQDLKNSENSLMAQLKRLNNMSSDLDVICTQIEITHQRNQLEQSLRSNFDSSNNNSNSNSSNGPVQTGMLHQFGGTKKRSAQQALGAPAQPLGSSAPGPGNSNSASGPTVETQTEGPASKKQKLN